MTAESQRPPLVWLPFSTTDLEGDGESAPGGLRYELFRPEPGQPLPPSADEVEFYVMPYRFSSEDVELIARLPRLKVVQTLTAGLDHVAGRIPQGVTLCNGRSIHETSTAELALTLTLASLRGVPDHVRHQDGAQWSFAWGESLADKRVLILGYGEIGRAIEKRLLPFEARVTRVARSAREGVHSVSDLPGLLPLADVVIVIVPGGRATAGLVDAAFLARMRDGALLVNVSRGSVVDTEALVRELTAERLKAAVDVTDPEPLPADHPLWRAPGVLVTPHVGGASTAMWPRAHRLVRDQLARFAIGAPLRNVS